MCAEGSLPNMTFFTRQDNLSFIIENLFTFDILNIVTGDPYPSSSPQDNTVGFISKSLSSALPRRSFLWWICINNLFMLQHQPFSPHT